jgi:uncharacterized protein involved in exopolysaccharide biosynthesis
MSDQVPELKQYIRAITSRLWLVVVVMALALGAAYGLAGRTPDDYSASTLLMVAAPVISEPAPVVADGGDNTFRPGVGIVSADVLQLITTYPIASRVAERLNLPGPRSVQRAIRADALRGTSLIRVTATAKDPQMAASLANATSEEFISYFRETNRASMVEVRKFTEQQLAQVRAKLDASERALQTFKERRGLPIVATVANQIVAQAAAAQAELDAATLAQRENDARLTVARSRLGKEQPMIVSSRATTDNPVFRRMEARLVDLELQRLQLSQVYTAQHPRMEQITREIAEVRTRLTSEAQRVVGQETASNNPIHTNLLTSVVALEVDRAAVDARVRALQATQRQRMQAVGSVPSAEAEFNRLSREQRVLENNYTTLSSRYQEIVLRENMAGFFPASVHVIEVALPPLRPVPSSFPRTAAAALASGLLLGVVATFVLESVDDRIRGAQDAEHVLGVPVLAQIPAHGVQARAVPVATMFVITIILVLTLAFAAVARGYVRLTTSDATDRVRSAAGVITAWAGDLGARVTQAR